MVIKLYNRKTKVYDIEKVAGHSALKALYENPVGKIGLELLIKRKFYTWITGVFCDSAFSRRSIKGFIDSYSIDMSISENKAEDFKSFNDFFTRKLTDNSRLFPKEPDILASPGDGRLKAFENIDMEKMVQIKGLTYSLKELVEDEQLAQKYQGGTCIILRLAPVDYHRFHFIDSGSCGKSIKINGYYYSVNPIALSSVPMVFCKNKREYSIFQSDKFGDILYMEVGATSVGAIVQTYTPGKHVDRGSEKGYFKFGGSTVILFIEKDKVKMDRDLIDQTELGYETRVLAGEAIGVCSSIS